MNGAVAAGSIAGRHRVLSCAAGQDMWKVTLPETTPVRKRPLPPLAAALWSALLVALAIYLLLKGRWQVFAWFVLISSLMTGGEAVYEILKRRQKKR